jgi:uncharacterized OsmC-like protein
MLGTLSGALEARGIRLDGEHIGAEAEGINELRDGVIVLTRIDSHYRLRIPADAREKVERALARHQEKCPTARSLAAAVAIGWSAEIEETAPGP